MTKQPSSFGGARVGVIAIILASLGLWCQSLLCEGSELDDVRNHASLMPSRLRSYQFTARFEAKEDDPKRHPTINSAKFYQSGGSFRVESDFVELPGVKIDPLARSTVFAYNGSRYQWFMAGRETLSFSSQLRHPNLYWLPNPVTLPYLWLAGPKANWADMKDAQVWLKRFEGARYEGEVIEKGVTFAVISTPLEVEPGVIVRVYFAKDRGYYPLKFVEYKDGSPWVTTEVTRFTTFEVDGGTLLFPLAITTKVEPPDGAKLNWTVSDVSIKVNHSIDEALFTVSPSVAKSVIDYDKDLKKLAQPRSEPNYVPKPPAWRGRLIVINSIVLAAVIGYFIYHRMRPRKKATTE
jgi:hypothetical protein